MDTWGRANTIATLIAAIVITLVLAYIGNIYIKTEKDKDAHRYMIDASLNILGQEPSKDNIEVRKWALNIINFYSPVRMHRAAQEELLHKIKFGRDFNSMLLESLCKDFKQNVRNQ